MKVLVLVQSKVGFLQKENRAGSPSFWEGVFPGTRTTWAKHKCPVIYLSRGYGVRILWREHTALVL